MLLKRREKRQKKKEKKNIREDLFTAGKGMGGGGGAVHSFHLPHNQE